MLSRNMDAPESAHGRGVGEPLGAACLCSAHVADARTAPGRYMPAVMRGMARHDHVEYGAEGGRVSVGSSAHPVLPSPPTPGIHRFTDAGSPARCYTSLDVGRFCWDGG
uniref:hypothetical protein n=1 Tax=Halomonas sp. TaxID=1486246 RepID=UPI0026269CAB|nr:hypothetical protein [Halomonas sp.]